MLKLPKTKKISTGMTVVSPDVNFFIRKIVRRQYFTSVKLNHAYWEAISNFPPEYEKMSILHTPEFLDEVTEILMKWPRHSSLMLGIGFCGMTYCSNMNDPHNSGTLAKVVANVVPPDCMLYDALIWKKLAHRGDLLKLFRVIQTEDIPVTVVGLSHLQQFADLFEWSFKQISIRATRQREEILADIIANHKQGTLYALQLGDSLGTWMGYKLHAALKDCFCIDFGRSLDLFVGDKNFSKTDMQEYSDFSSGRDLKRHMDGDNFINQPWFRNFDESTTY